MDKGSRWIECQLTVKKASFWVIRKLRLIADYQFFVGAGLRLFPLEVDVSLSSKTGKAKEIREHGIHLGTLNPRSGTLSLSIEGATRLKTSHRSPNVIVRSEYASPISTGGNVFAKHVAEAEESIRSGNEAIILSEDLTILAVGRSHLSGEEAKRFKRGVAIKVRRGVRSNHVSENGS